MMVCHHRVVAGFLNAKYRHNLTSLRRSGKVFVFGKNSILCPFTFPCGKTYGHLICISYMKKYLRFLTPFNTVSVYLMESKKRHRISYGVWDRKRVLIFHISTLYPASIKIFDFTSCSLPLKTLILLDYLMFSY